jgi:hypothetical protein
MESLKNTVLVLAVVVITYMAINGSFTTDPITNPTAQQAIQNHVFMQFIVYAGVALAVTMATVYTRRMDVFFILVTAISFIWFILGKTWQK